MEGAAGLGKRARIAVAPGPGICFHRVASVGGFIPGALMKKRMVSIPAAVLVSAAALTARALEPGDKAPSLAGVAEWINGGAVDPAAPDGRHVYVVEFWATWCGPCRVTMPHLDELQKKHAARAVFVGITDEPAETVRPFLEKLPVTYRIGLDTKKAATAAYMEGVEGIPHAFIVGTNGLVAWAGHPLDGLETALEGVLEGSYDPARARALRDRRDGLLELIQDGRIREALTAIDTSLADDPRSMELNQMKAGLLMNEGDREGLRAHLNAMLDAYRDAPLELNELAWMIAAPSPIPLEFRDPEVAWKAANRAAELTDRRDAAVLDTLAMVQYSIGRIDDAIRTQEEALALAEDDEKAEVRRRLDFYGDVRRLRAAVDAAPGASAPVPAPAP
jgi:thiol-disulfide isomerase/thioredoxin